MSSPTAAACDPRSPIPAAAGIGLRFAHHRRFLEDPPAIPWLEVHTENYLGGGPTPRCLDAIRAKYPISLHGVGLSLGSAEGLDEAHLARVQGAVVRFAPALVSEHLSFSVVDGTYLADLLPLPMTEEALAVVCRNADAAQAALGRRILVENPSTYLQLAESTIPEAEFLREAARATGCGILLDVNNLYVSAFNHGLDARRYLDMIPSRQVAEIHLAGHTRRGGGHREFLIDTHDAPVADAVWALYRRALERFGPVATLIEWDAALPSLERLLAEAGRAQAAMETPYAHAA